MGISLGRFRDDGWGYALRDSGTTDEWIHPFLVIPDLFRDLGLSRDLGLPRDLLKKAEI